MSSEFRDELLQSYSEAELARYTIASPPTPPPRHDNQPRPPSSVYLLSENLVAKGYALEDLPDVARTDEVIRKLGIRVPNILRTITLKNGGYCIMERIHGETLEDAWASLGWFTTVSLALQLRRFVNILRSVTSTTAGSLETGRCRSFWLEDKYELPDWSTAENIRSFLQFWARFTSIRKEARGETNPPPRIPPTADTFVLTHHDLAPRNIILAPSGQLWLLDWDFAGFYPIYFEYAGMQNFFVPPNWGFFGRLRWALFSWIAVGRYEEHARLLRSIRSKFTRFYVGRRFELLKNGGPTHIPVS